MPELVVRAPPSFLRSLDFCGQLLIDRDPSFLFGTRRERQQLALSIRSYFSSYKVICYLFSSLTWRAYIPYKIDHGCRRPQ